MITSTANPQVKALARLKQRSERTTTGTFPIEGHRTVERAFAAGWPLAGVVVAPDLATPAATALAAEIQSSGVPLTELGAAAFRRIAYRRHPDGILAVGRSRPIPLEALAIAATPLLLVVEAIEKPGNLGAMLRTADAAGIDAVIVAEPATDVYNPNVVRASQGALFVVPLAAATAAEVRSWLERRDIRIVAASTAASLPPWEIDLTGARAIVVGSEHEGLSPAWDGAPTVRIPMRGAGDSLNASIAAAVLAYEALRQRG